MGRSIKDLATPTDEADLRNAVDQLSGKSEAELFQALKEATAQERKSGNLDNTRMDDIYEKLSPMLNDKQRAKMQEVLRRLKE